MSADDGATSLTDTYTYPSHNNRLQTIAYGSGGTRTYTYDGAGHVTAVAEATRNTTYAYNAAGRLVGLTIDGTPESEYRYNALGQQVIRKLNASGQIIHAVHDLDGNRLAEYDYDPTTQTTTLLREYIWLDGEAVGVVENDQLYFVRTDHIGRPTIATDAAGIVVWTVAYRPFGEVDVSTGTPISLRFPGQWFQVESGLHQNWMRDYDPTLGRYLQADPLGLVDGASVYGYALQNPGRYTDPRGEYCVTLNGTTTCRVKEKYEFSFPKPSGWPNNGGFAPGNNWYHLYDKSVIDRANLYDVECLMRGLIAMPDPAPSNGANAGGTSNYANPGGWGEAFGLNPVTGYVVNDPVSGYSGIVNVTEQGHALSHGIVVRLATPHGILTYGEGNGFLQRPGSRTGQVINNVWPQMNINIMNQCSCGNQL